MDLEHNQQVNQVDDKQIKTTPFALTSSSREILARWCKGHFCSDSMLNEVPKIGLMVWYCGRAIGVCFLREIEGNKGLIDGFLCDPTVDYKIRIPCLDRLIIDLIKLAKFYNMRGVLGLSSNKRVIKRAKKLGFNSMPHTLVEFKFPSTVEYN